MNPANAQKVKLLKEKLSQVEKNIAQLDEAMKTKGLSPLEKMQLNSLKETKKDYEVKLKVYSR